MSGKEGDEYMGRRMRIREEKTGRKDTMKGELGREPAKERDRMI